MSYSDEIASALQGRIRETEEDLGRMKAALATLEPTEEPTEAPRKTPRPKRTRRRATNGNISEEALLTSLRLGHANQATSLAQELDADVNAVRKMLHGLYEAGQVTRTGERAGTRWGLPDEVEEVGRRR